MREGKLSVDDRQLEELTGAWLAREPGVRELLRADLAPATWRAYAGAFRRLEEDLNGRMLTDIELARHCVQLWRRGRARSERDDGVGGGALANAGARGGPGRRDWPSGAPRAAGGETKRCREGARTGCRRGMGSC